MSLYWQAKIWGLLQEPALRELTAHTGELWQDLEVMGDYPTTGKAWDHIRQAQDIAAASDRSALGKLALPGGSQEVRHLLSGARRGLSLSGANPGDSLFATTLGDTPLSQVQDPRKLFWWLWRCLPEHLCQSDPSLMLKPAQPQLPDASLWSSASVTAALGGALAGYDGPPGLAALAVFSFAPVQELIKASRKMRDFWAGSWVLHYLAARVSWTLAFKYGPDTLLYPSLFQQPLIDQWLRQQWPELGPWVKEPTPRSLLTAGFPNVLALVLPRDRVAAAMQLAEQTLKAEWLDLGRRVFRELHQKRHWQPGLHQEHPTWEGWLKSQWEIYWSALPIGQFPQSLSVRLTEAAKSTWVEAQNRAYQVPQAQLLFPQGEEDFLAKYAGAVNIGSWWPHIFDQARLALSGVKNARTWQLPTVFSVRSTVSGLGPAVHSGQGWVSPGVVKDQWLNPAGLFDGRELLNATEVLKRGLHLVLPDLLGVAENRLSYPDLTSGVAGYLKNNPDARHHFLATSRGLYEKLGLPAEPWGIPWADKDPGLRRCHPRYLNAGWCSEEMATKEMTPEKRQQRLREAQALVNQSYPGNNPTDWYVLVAGDGDGMSKWLKGDYMKAYGDYLPDQVKAQVGDLARQTKRMGPSTHSALSRALLDFSNQLVPYLTEQRYAGRLVYGGGDDVLAYTNLWEWDAWLWDIRQCFRGDRDPQGEFIHEGDYWHWQDQGNPPEGLARRPLFTMGGAATISFGVVVAHQSVPLAIALENLWQAEKAAKGVPGKDALQVRVLYGNGNRLECTGHFQAFDQWRALLRRASEPSEPALFEQAAQLWQDHPIPTTEAIEDWVRIFCHRRDYFQGDQGARDEFSAALVDWLREFPLDPESPPIPWLKLAAFVLRKRDIKIAGA